MIKFREISRKGQINLHIIYATRDFIKLSQDLYFRFFLCINHKVAHFLGKMQSKNTMYKCRNSNFSPQRLDQSSIWVTGGKSDYRPEQIRTREGSARTPRNNCHKTSWRIFRSVHWKRRINLPQQLLCAAGECKLGRKFKFLCTVFSISHPYFPTS